mgnify:CR=1 FL=1
MDNGHGITGGVGRLTCFAILQIDQTVFFKRTLNLNELPLVFDNWHPLRVWNPIYHEDIICNFCYFLDYSDCLPIFEWIHGLLKEDAMKAVYSYWDVSLNIFLAAQCTIKSFVIGENS